jgi:hypothetical protein
LEAVFSLWSVPTTIGKLYQTNLRTCFLWGPVTGFIKASIGIIIVIGIMVVVSQSSGEEVSERFNRPTKSRSESLTVK